MSTIRSAVLQANRTASAIALAVLAIAIFAVVALRSSAMVPLDARFPTSPSTTDLATLRRAYATEPSSWPRPRLLPGAHFAEMAPLSILPQPTGKARDLARIGAKLFEDPLLSASGHIACQSCHNRRLGWGDGLPTSFGHGRAKGKRNAPGLFTAAYRSPLFWDGRSSSLEEQALAPLADNREMANADNFVGLLERINASDRYRAEFASVTGRPKIDLEDVTAALAEFQRTLERQTRFDRFLEGQTNALSDTEIWGLHLFRTKAGCANCHNGPTLSDGRFHNLGLSFFNRTLEDLGRYGVTGNAEDTGKFLTPSLRHVSRTGPYMHNGIFPSLAGTVRFYEGGGGRVRIDETVTPPRRNLMQEAAKKSPQLEPFELTPDEVAALVAYLQTL
ncbi:cytochrome-c peroxidase [Hyphomicrobium sp.]|uniref:cytochrome-c peroxidase n=1 Tax=Hyphomicrobium sp. TaxID=82 RepID=UPI002E3021DD|nr:cytochrome c peroxidase [Hyphomicrobium sp.]HEX2842519.1 cytochrome c peroxidase [Hyphomicrobium sp.]